MSKKQPAFQFYTGDWLKDPNLGMCGAATRGIWIDMLASMHERDRCGQLEGTVIQLARICRCTPDEMTDALHELKATQTADVTFCNDFETNKFSVVTVENRRMREAYKERENNKLRVKRHREKQQCNSEVTTLTRASSSSSSSSSVIGEGGSNPEPPTRTREAEPPPPELNSEKLKQEIPRPEDPLPVGYAMTRLTNFGMHYSHVGDAKDRARIAGWVRKGLTVQAFEDALLQADQARRAAVSSAEERPEPLYARHVEPFLFASVEADQPASSESIQNELEQWYAEEQAAGRLP